MNNPAGSYTNLSSDPLEVLNFNPFARYYGKVTSPAFFGVLLAKLWHWTGDRSFVQPLVDPAIKAFEWLDGYAQLKGDDFYWFQKRSKKGLKNQGWMDSSQSILYPDGSEVPDPIAPCDVQGFAYQAKMSLAEILSGLGEQDRVEHYFQEARELKERFNEKFWMEDEQLIAVGLDPQQQQIKSCISNSGILLTTGSVEEQRARLIAERLFQADLFSGWGIRTLSSRHPAYNPFSYRRGAVWPFEQAMTAHGFMLHDLIEPMHTLCRGAVRGGGPIRFLPLTRMLQWPSAPTRPIPFPASTPRQTGRKPGPPQLFLPSWNPCSEFTLTRLCIRCFSIRTCPNGCPN